MPQLALKQRWGQACCSLVLHFPSDELEGILEEKIKDNMEEEMDEDLAIMIRSDTVTMTIEAMNDNIADNVVKSLHARVISACSLNTN